MAADYLRMVMTIFVKQSRLTNKKSKLMLMRRARSYGSSCLQVILVNFYPFSLLSLRGR